MNYRFSKILSPEDIGATGTKVIELSVKDAISRIDIDFYTKNVSDNFADHPAANITKIELIDGSDVLFSLSGKECQALNFYDRLRPSGNHSSGKDTEYMRGTFGLDFGRHLFDPTLAFDPTKFKNPQLKISWDEDIANTSCISNFLRVQAHLFDEAIPSPIGFLSAKNIYSYTPAANAFEYMDLPTDRPIRKMLVGSPQVQKTLTMMLAEIKLSEDNDKRVPLDVTSRELLWLNRQNFPEYFEIVNVYFETTDKTFRVTPYEDAMCNVNCRATTNVAMACFDYGGRATGRVTVSPESLDVHVHGYIPHGLAAIPFGDQNDIADWYDVTKIGSLVARLKAGASLGTNPLMSVILQQLRSY